MSSPFGTGLPKLMRAIAELRELDPELPAHTALAFLSVAEAGPEGITQHELGIRLGISSSATQRNVKLMSKLRGVDTPGLGLLEVTTPIENGRMRVLRLSAKGQKLAAKLAKIVE